MGKLILRKSCYEGIKNVLRNQFIPTEKYKKGVQEANRKIDSSRQREARAWYNASKYLVEEASTDKNLMTSKGLVKKKTK